MTAEKGTDEPVRFQEQTTRTLQRLSIFLEQKKTMQKCKRRPPSVCDSLHKNTILRIGNRWRCSILEPVSEL